MLLKYIHTKFFKIKIIIRNYDRDWFEKYDEPGNKILNLIGFDENDIEICHEYLCDKDDCNCSGHWKVGNDKNVHTWIGRPV